MIAFIWLRIGTGCGALANMVMKTFGFHISFNMSGVTVCYSSRLPSVAVFGS
jgi:hypothetical protein